MTTDQIKAELRRSACEDEKPRMAHLQFGEPWRALCQFRILKNGEYFGFCTDTRFRIYMLLVAEALE